MISIIIPTYNEEANLKKLLPYLLEAKAAVEFEVLVSVSAYNNDKSLEFLESYKEVKVINIGKGRANQMNLGAAQSQGDILVFLHADVWPPKEFLRDILNAINTDKEAGFFSYRFDSPSKLLKLNASFTKRDGLFTGGGDQCLFIKSKTFFELGGFDEAQVLMEDFEFFKRMKKNKVSYTIIDNPLVVSARKYEHNSYIRINLSNFLLLSLFKLGYPALSLKQLHHKLIRTPYQ